MLLLGVHVAVALLGVARAVGPLLVAVLAQELLILLHNQNLVLHLTYESQSRICIICGIRIRSRIRILITRYIILRFNLSQYSKRLCDMFDYVNC